MSRSWYQYNGGDETIVGNYSALSFPFGLCIGGNTICAVYAVYGGANPAFFSARLQGYFTPAKAAASPSGYPQPGKSYVYTLNT